MSESEELQHLNERVKALNGSLSKQGESIADLRADVKRALEWMTAITFDDRGAFQQGETPPILKLLAAIQDDNHTLKSRLEVIVSQNAILIGEPTNEEAAVLSDARIKGGVSLPALLYLVGEVRFWIRVVMVLVGLMFLLLVAHHWYLVARFSDALGWLGWLLGGW